METAAFNTDLFVPPRRRVLSGGRTRESIERVDENGHSRADDFDRSYGPDGWELIPKPGANPDIHFVVILPQGELRIRQLIAEAAVQRALRNPDREPLLEL